MIGDILIVIIGLLITRSIVDKFELFQNSHLNLTYLFGYSYAFLSSLIIIPAIFILVFQYNNLYKANVYFTRANHFTNIIKSHLYTGILIVFYAFIIKFAFIRDSRWFVTIFLFTSIILFFILRIFIFRSIFIFLVKNKIFLQRILLVGAGKAGRILATKLLFENEFGIKVVGFVDDNLEVETPIIQSIKVLGKIYDISRIVRENDINEVIIAIDKLTYERLNEIIETCNDLQIPTRISSELFNIVNKKIEVEKYSNIPIIDATPKFDIKYSLIFKRVFDIIFSFLILLLLSPFLLLISIFIKLFSDCPVIFKQKRIGKNGDTFLFYKFRTMYSIDGEDNERKEKMIDFIKSNKSGSVCDTKIINDNRVTRIGRFLRKFSLDELPQLINVLKGDMSLVGPRPSLPYEYKNYDGWQKKRHSVLPGCTGVWQVWGRSSVSFKDSVVLDLYYINNMSPWLDLQLILKTIPVMLFARGGK